MSSDHWPNQSLLDALRPEQGWEVERAILATYSLDLVTLVATMLALAGLDDDRGSGSKVDFANAYEQLRFRLHVLVQKGRISFPKHSPTLIGILDRFICEVSQDENIGSWHPKIALIKYHSETGAFKWRLWIGSRNLSQTMGWEAGLLLHGAPNILGHKIDGISELGSMLATKLGAENFDAKNIAQELQNVSWQVPDGVQVDFLQLLTPDQERNYPTELANIQKLIVVSPFLDGETMNRLGMWGDRNTERYLLSTISEMSRLNSQASNPLRHFSSHLLVLDAPVDEDFLTDLADQEEIAEEEKVERQLHAKLLLAKHTQGYTLWLGSANATQRGWLGPNYEVITQLTVNQKIADGLWAFVELAKPVIISDLPDSDEDDAIEERLETARKQVINRWQVKQVRQPDGVNLVAACAPHPDDLEISMEMGLVTGASVSWPRETLSIELPLDSKAKETQLVQVRLLLGNKQITWLQIAPLDPPPSEERDDRALAMHLSPRVFLLWLRSMLSIDELLDGGGEWHTSPQTYSSSKTGKGIIWWSPTLEEVLSSWTRSPNNLLLVDQKVQKYLKLIRDKEQEGNFTEEERNMLADFENVWQVIRKAFVEGQA